MTLTRGGGFPFPFPLPADNLRTTPVRNRDTKACDRESRVVLRELCLVLPFEILLFISRTSGPTVDLPLGSEGLGSSVVVDSCTTVSGSSSDAEGGTQSWWSDLDDNGRSKCVLVCSSPYLTGPGVSGHPSLGSWSLKARSWSHEMCG